MIVLITLAAGLLGWVYGRFGKQIKYGFLSFTLNRRESVGSDKDGDRLSIQERISHYQRVFDTIDQAIIIRDISGSVVFFNEAWRRFTELDDVELYKEKGLQLNRFILSDGNTPATEQDAPMYKALRGQATKNRFLYFSSKTKTKTPVLVSGYPLQNEHDEQIGGVAVVHDISERYQVEQELERERVLLHTIIRALPDAFVFRNMLGQATLVNDAMRQLRHPTGEGQFLHAVLHGNFLDHQTGEAIPDGHTPIERALLGETVVREELVQVRPNGQPVDLLATSIPVYDNNKQQYGAFSILQDITALKMATEHRDKERRAQALHNLAAGLAHDFNNQLGAILGNAQLALAQRGDPESIHEHLRAIVDVVQNSTELTRRLMTLGNTTGGDPQPISVQTVLSNFLANTRALFETDIDLTVAGSDSDLCIYCDRSQFESALLNLLLNAKDATQSIAKPQVSVRVKKLNAFDAESKGLESEYEYVSIAVEDNGAGFTSQSRDEAFDPFYSTKPETSGSGLGLTMVEGFVRQYSGQVTISDRFSELTCIEMLLPLVDTSELSTIKQVVDVDLIRGNGEMVLVVEDRVDVLTMICEMLSMLNYRSVRATNAEEGLLQLDGNPSIVLVIVDVMLGYGMNGVVMMDVAKKHRPDLKTIFSSGYAGNRGEITLPKNSLFLQKPYELETLSQMLHQQIGQTAIHEAAFTQRGSATLSHHG